MIEIWVNPACSKCRTAVSEIEGSGHEYMNRKYLESPPTVQEIEDVLTRLGLEPWDITRRPDAHALGIELPSRSPTERGAWVALLATNPKLIQRPIITASDGTTVVGRDPASVQRVIAAEA